MSHRNAYEAKFDEFGLVPTAQPQVKRIVNLDKLREELETAKRLQDTQNVTIPLDELLSIIERTETAESLTNVFPCATQLNLTNGLWMCLLHDTSFELDEKCELSGKSVLNQLEDNLAAAQTTAMAAKTQTRLANAKLAAVNTLVSEWEALHGTEIYMLQKLRTAINGATR